MLPLEQPPSAGFGLVEGILGHVVGWPIPRGGSQKIADALAAYLRSLGGEIITGVEAKSLDALQPDRVIQCNGPPRQLLRIAGERLPEAYHHQLQRYRYGQGESKIV